MSTDTTMSLVRGAQQGGAKIFERTTVTGTTIESGRVTGVTTETGTIEAEHVMNCAGMWGRAFGELQNQGVKRPPTSNRSLPSTL